MTTWSSKSEKAKALDNSRPLNIERTCKDKVFINACKSLLTKLFAKHRGKKRHGESYIHQLVTIVHNLHITWLCDGAQFVSYHRSTEAYEPGTKLRTYGLTRVGVTTCADFLVEEGYATAAPGFYDRETGVRFTARIRATQKLIDFIEIENGSLPSILCRRKKLEVLVLKDASGEVVAGWDETPETRRMTRNLFSINKLLRGTHVLLAIKDTEIKELQVRLAERIWRKKKARKKKKPRTTAPKAIDFSATQLHRVFNLASWEYGGRFYGGWWLRVPKEYRKFITINDELTVELDYKAHHIRMLYSLEGIHYKEDPYRITPETTDDERKFYKIALLTILNAETYDDALSAIMKEINIGELRGLEGIDKDNFESLLKSFAAKHSLISHRFYTGIGRRLQNYDSRIAEKVLLHFTRKGIPVLPVHDSFIISHKHKAELEEVMLKSFLGVFEHPTSVDAKKSHFDILKDEYGTVPPLAYSGFRPFAKSIPGLADLYLKYFRLSSTLSL